MTNQERYKTPQERDRAFTTFCIEKNCGRCQCYNKGANCRYVWLTLEAEEEPDNCPCCGGESVVVVRDNPTMTKNVYVRCTLCGMSTSAFNTNAEAIAAWNRRAK